MEASSQKASKPDAFSPTFPLSLDKLSSVTTAGPHLLWPCCLVPFPKSQYLQSSRWSRFLSLIVVWWCCFRLFIPASLRLRHLRTDVVSCLPQCLHITDRTRKQLLIHGQAQHLLTLQESPWHICAISPLATFQAF